MNLGFWFEEDNFEKELSEHMWTIKIGSWVTEKQYLVTYLIKVTVKYF